MRISETGTTDGFTLVELMTVLVIVGLLSAAMLIAMPDRNGTLRAEAERFAARAKAAEDRAVIGARPLSLRVDAEGYAVDSRAGSEWRQEKAYRFNQGIKAVIGPTGPARIVFDQTGSVEPARVVLGKKGAQTTIAFAYDGRISIDD
jgi:general secretion pathway protein H